MESDECGNVSFGSCEQFFTIVNAKGKLIETMETGRVYFIKFEDKFLYRRDDRLVFEKNESLQGRVFIFSSNSTTIRTQESNMVGFFYVYEGSFLKSVLLWDGIFDIVNIITDYFVILTQSVDTEPLIQEVPISCTKDMKCGELTGVCHGNCPTGYFCQMSPNGKYGCQKIGLTKFRLFLLTLMTIIIFAFFAVVVFLWIWKPYVKEKISRKIREGLQEEAFQRKATV